MAQQSAPVDTFAEFVRARSAALSRVAFLLTGDHHRSEDLLQQALFKAARVWPRIESNPEAYVRRILYNENISWWRRRKVAETGLDAAAHAATAGGPDVDTRLAVIEALSKLTAKQRTVLVLRYYEDLTEAQTAAVLGIAVGTVKSQTRQALARLRTLAPDLEDLLTVGGDLS